MSRLSCGILEANKALAYATFGPSPPTHRMSAEDRHEMQLDDEWQAKKLTPLIVGGAAAAAFGGLVGMTPKQRLGAAGLAAVFFLAI